jgi:cell division protease FtsH
MSDLGPLTFGERDELIFLGRELTAHKNFSERTAELIDDEIKQIISRNYDRAQKLLEEHGKELEAIARLLLEREIISSDDIKAVLAGVLEGAAPAESKTPPAAPAPPASPAPAAAPAGVPPAAPEPALA